VRISPRLAGARPFYSQDQRRTGPGCERQHPGPRVQHRRRAP
jgi:hypothetical protein